MKRPRDTCAARSNCSRGLPAAIATSDSPWKNSATPRARSEPTSGPWRSLQTSRPRAEISARPAKAGKFRDAVPHLRRACEAYPDAAKIHLLLGQALSQLAEEAQALRCYQRAVAVDARLVDGWAGLGACLRALGRFPEAAKAYERALAIDPQARAAVYGLSTIQHEITDAAELDRLRRTSANPDIITENRQAAAMALVKKLDKSGRYDEAFTAAVEGNRLARAAQEAADIRHDHDGTRAGVDAVMRAITPEFLAGARDWGNPTELPVFIVGFFRTGSTLTEQICASHSRVHGIGKWIKSRNWWRRSIAPSRVLRTGRRACSRISPIGTWSA